MASVPLPHQFSVGEQATSTNINSYYSAISFLENVPIASLYQVTFQTIGSGGSGTAITLDGSNFDTYNGHSVVTNNSRYTFQVPGYYLISGMVAWAPNATGPRTAFLRLNGSSGLLGSQGLIQAVSTGGTNTNVVTGTVMTVVAVNDYIELLGVQVSGGNLATNTGGINTSQLTIAWMHA